MMPNPYPSEYAAWRSMRERCNNSNLKIYVNYGGRGIKVCPKWDKSFEAFYEDMGPRPSPEHSLDRIGNNSPYAPWNCRWATRNEQQRNKRNTNYVEWEGQRWALADLAERYGLAIETARHRWKAGWSIEDVLTRPIDAGKSLGGERSRKMTMAHPPNRTRRSPRKMRSSNRPRT